MFRRALITCLICCSILVQSQLLEPSVNNILIVHGKLKTSVHTSVPNCLTLHLEIASHSSFQQQQQLCREEEDTDIEITSSTAPSSTDSYLFLVDTAAIDCSTPCAARLTVTDSKDHSKTFWQQMFVVANNAATVDIDLVTAVSSTSSSSTSTTTSPSSLNLLAVATTTSEASIHKKNSSSTSSLVAVVLTAVVSALLGGAAGRLSATTTTSTATDTLLLEEQQKSVQVDDGEVQQPKSPTLQRAAIQMVDACCSPMIEAARAVAKRISGSVKSSVGGSGNGKNGWKRAGGRLKRGAAAAAGGPLGEQQLGMHEHQDAKGFGDHDSLKEEE